MITSIHALSDDALALRLVLYACISIDLQRKRQTDDPRWAFLWPLYDAAVAEWNVRWSKEP